ncbi:MAG: type II toxin-antitoxin system RelB/DinJ family antitoxin [Mycoplasmataceae bacterium]|jgi:addiction module RelB/DinJ family antitoxin|nr:type II toxin-antitoxin system RelB/DinJ family antitoxin [Mycoplasmataceae bacterium]
MEKVLVSFRVDKFKKQQAERLCKELGMNLSTLLNVLLTKSISCGRIPFEVDDSRFDLNKFLEFGKECANKCNAPYMSYEEVSELVREERNKK